METSLKPAGFPIDLKKLRAETKTGIGGSDAAALFGKSPWKTPMDVFVAKTGLAREEAGAMSSVQEAGLRLEPTLLQWYMDKQNVDVLPHPEMIKHPEHDFMIGHLDGFILKEGKPDGVLELKTAMFNQAYKWGSDGTDEVPESYNIQVHHYMAITGLKYAEIAVLLGGSDFRIYRIERNEELIDVLIAQEKHFWETYIVPVVAPPVDGSDSAARMLRLLYPDSEDQELLSNEEINKLCLSMYSAINRAEEAGAEAQARKNEVMALMKEKGILSGPGYRITWKTGKERDVLDKDGLIAELKPLPELIAKYTETKPGTRVFRPGKLKQEKE